MSKCVKCKGRDFDWERLACAITSHIGKLQNYPAKMPVSILRELEHSSIKFWLTHAMKEKL